MVGGLMLITSAGTMRPSAVAEAISWHVRTAIIPLRWGACKRQSYRPDYAREAGAAGANRDVAVLQASPIWRAV